MNLAKKQIIEITVDQPRGPQGPKRKTLRRVCQVCGEEFETARHQARFCSEAHKVIFNNIRRTRGAVLYDFFMMLRYDRKAAEKLDLWSCMCALGFVWREEDKGKETWGDVREHLAKMPYLKKTPDLLIEKNAAVLAAKQKKKGGE